MWVAVLFAANPGAHVTSDYAPYIAAVNRHGVRPGDDLGDPHVRACLADCEAAWQASGVRESAEQAGRAALGAIIGPRAQIELSQPPEREELEW